MRSIDASRIARGLYQGGAPPTGPHVRRAGFDTLVLMAEEFQPRSAEFRSEHVSPLRLVHAGIDDASLTQEMWDRALRAARHVSAVRAGGGRVLVTCQMGWNRSGIVSALSLVMLDGLSGDAAVDLVRLARSPSALCNKSFADAVRRFGAAPRGRARPTP